MSHPEDVCDLMVENGNMKKLLCEILIEMECRVRDLRILLPAPFLTTIHRNERIVSDIKNYIKDFDCKEAIRS